MKPEGAKMATEKLLIIDDDKNLLTLLSKIFKKSGYRVATAHNARKALASLEREMPDLILLDLMLPDINGYELLEKIKARPEWAFIPVVILSAITNLEDKLKGLRLGVMDYITKPFEREELEARVRNILDFYHLKVHKQEIPAKPSHQRLIDYMKDQGIRALVPQVSRLAKLGYEYPDVAHIFSPDEPGGEIYMLEGMAKSKMLDRVFHDAIHICPFCGHHDINFREVCPHCDQANIERKQLITHHICGFRGMLPEPEPHAELRCPQCGDLLHTRGEDFEILPSSLNVCLECEAEFTETVMSCRCMNCERIFDASAAPVRKVHTYKLRTDSDESCLDPPPDFFEPGEMQDFQTKIQESKLPFLSPDNFDIQVDREVNLAKKRDREVSLLGILFKKVDAFIEQPGGDADRIVQSILEVLRTVLRDYDVVTATNPFEWIVMLPETPFRIARILADRMYSGLIRREFTLKVELSMASFPGDGTSGAELLQVLRLGIVNYPSTN